MMNFLIPLLIVLETADGVITYSAIGKGLVGEANPVIQNIAGTGNFLLMKIMGAIICAWILWLVYKLFPRISLVTTSGILMFYAIVLIWNLSILFNFSLL
jgi:hypothetical protein